MTRLRDRIIALILAGVFFVTSVGISVVVIWEVLRDKEGVSVNENNPSAGGQLQGTQLPGFTPVAQVGELQVLDQKAGDGDTVQAGDSVNVDYTGAVAATGVIFQSSLDMDQSVTLSLDGVIEGWGEGLVGMKVGGQRRLLIPAAKAYGANPPQGIPANADLVFDITLHGIEKP